MNPTRMDTMASPSPDRSLWGGIRFLYGKFWRILVAGFLLWLPLIITLWVSWWVLSKLVFGIERLIKAIVLNLHALAERVPALDFLALVRYQPGLGILLTITGTLGAWAGGKLDDAIGGKTVILGAIACLLFACIGILSLGPGQVAFVIEAVPATPGLSRCGRGGACAVIGTPSGFAWRPN